VAPIINGIIVHFRFHIRCISIHKLFYFNFFSASFLIIIIIIIIIITIIIIIIIIIITSVPDRALLWLIYQSN
jgi:hypothetical protein